MIPENTPRKSYWYGPYKDYELRCRRRLQNDLGIDEAAAETILHLRKQVIELQAHIRQLETERNSQNDSQQFRLTRYREIYFEAAWTELEIEE